VVEAGNLFTLELGVPTSAGLVGLEEDVLVTVTGGRVSLDEAARPRAHLTASN
jgi:hypothetical protein